MFFLIQSVRSRNSVIRRSRPSNQMSGVPIRSIPESFRFFWKGHMLQKRENRESVSFSVRIGFFLSPVPRKFDRQNGRKRPWKFLRSNVSSRALCAQMSRRGSILGNFQSLQSGKSAQIIIGTGKLWKKVIVKYNQTKMRLRRENVSQMSLELYTTYFFC